MTPLEVIITLALCCIIIILAQAWHASRTVAKERRRADHWHRLYLDCPRSITEAHEWALERGRSEGYQEAIDDLENDRPAPQPAIVTMAESMRPLFEQAFGPPEWKDPAHVPAHVITDLQPQTVEVRAIEAPGELTVEFERNLVTMLAEMEAHRIRAQENLQ